MKKKALLLMMSICCLFLTGCNNEALQQKINEETVKAEQSLSEARRLGALKWAPAEYASAKNKFDEGQSLVAEKNYQGAQDALTAFHPLVNEAKAKTKTEKHLFEQYELKRKALIKQREVEMALKAEAHKKELAKRKTYIVQPGDHIWSIARQFNVHPHDIQQANEETLKNPDSLKIGQKLFLP